MVNEIWTELADEASRANGLVLRRCPVEILPNIFVGVEGPYGYKCIAVSLPNEDLIDLNAFNSLEDIALTYSNQGATRNDTFLVLKLTEHSLEEIFGVLCEDLIASVSSLTREALVLQEILARLSSWKALFERASATGLSLEFQAGLFGELYFLEIAIDHGCEPSTLLGAWVGPTGNVRDYQLGQSALEVKTSRGTSHQQIHISNERQLDPTHLDNLFLFHVSLEVLKDTNETLNHIVDRISAALASGELSRFKSLLLSYGYFAHHRELYADTSYKVREGKLFKVAGDFPRIGEHELRRGVGDVKYSIIKSLCTPFEVDFSAALLEMKLL